MPAAAARRRRVALAAFLLLGCAAAQSPQWTVHGRLQLPDAPRAGQMVVELRDDSADRMLAEDRRRLPDDGGELRFRLQLPRERVASGHSFSVRALVRSNDGAIWLGDSVPADPAHAGLDLGTLPLARAPRPLAFASRIDCGGRVFVFGMAGDVPTLRDGAVDIAMQASGADPDGRLEAVGDPSTHLLTQRASATVVLRGVSYAGCSVSR